MSDSDSEEEDQFKSDDDIMSLGEAGPSSVSDCTAVSDKGTDGRQCVYRLRVGAKLGRRRVQHVLGTWVSFRRLLLDFCCDLLLFHCRVLGKGVTVQPVNNGLLYDDVMECSHAGWRGFGYNLSGGKMPTIRIDQCFPCLNCRVYCYFSTYVYKPVAPLFT